jgi:hypothetical protein
MVVIFSSGVCQCKVDADIDSVYVCGVSMEEGLVSMALIDLFKNNAKYIDVKSIYMYQVRNTYIVGYHWKLTFYSERLHRGWCEMVADNPCKFVEYIEDLFSDEMYLKSDWLEIRDNNFYYNENQLTVDI